MSVASGVKPSTQAVSKTLRCAPGRDGSTTYAEYLRSDCPQARSETGATLVFLHGFISSHSCWDPLALSLLERPDGSVARILAIDLPGHGASRLKAAKFTMEVAARSVEDVLDASQTKSCLLTGYSMGGRLGLYFGLTRSDRVRGLILESTSAGLATAEERSARKLADERLAQKIQREGVPAFVSHWEALPLFATQVKLSDQALAQQRRLRLEQNPEGLAASLRGMGTGSQPWLGDRLGSLAMPVKWIAGSEDSKFCEIAKQMHARTPRSQLAIVRDAGHAVHLEARCAFEDELNDFALQQQHAKPEARAS